MQAPAAYTGLLLSLFCYLTTPDNWPCAVTTMSEETTADKELIRDSNQVGAGRVLAFPSLFAWNARVSQPRLNNKGSEVLSASC